MSLPLERLQSRFAAALIDPSCAPDVAAELLPSDARVLDRLGLYRGNMHAAWEKALASAYPVVRALVGEEFFSGLARTYGRAHPSRSGDLNRMGTEFADFVRGFAHAQSLPYLGDIAVLEWEVHRAHDAVDVRGLARERITVLPANDLLGARFALHPACAWIASSFPIVGIWLAHQLDANAALPTTLVQPEFALVVRPGWRVEVLASSAGEIAALTALHDGADIERTIGAALTAEPGFNFASALVRWLDKAILVEMRIAVPNEDA